MQVRTAAHQGLIDALRQRARETRVQIGSIDGEIEELKAQRDGYAKRLQALPFDEDLDEMTHEDLAALVEMNGVDGIDGELMFDGVTSPYEEDEDADGHITRAEQALGVE